MHAYKPSNWLTYSWYLIVALSTTYIAIWVPIEYIFEHAYLPPVFYWLERLTYVIFALDMALSAFRSWKVAKSSEELFQFRYYNRSLQVFDVIAILPLGLIFGVSLLDIIRLAKFVKVTHYYKILRFLEIKYTNSIELGFFIYWTVMVAHWITCIWLNLRGFEPELGDYSNYIRAIYWTVTTLTTIGYGDITPEGDIQTIFTMFVQILGVALYGYIIGSVASIISRSDPAKVQYLNHLDNLNALAKYRYLPVDLQKRLHSYYTYLWEQKMGFDESDFLGDLPPALKREVSMYLKKDAVLKIPVFKEANDRLLMELAMCLSPMVLLPNDVLFHAGEQGEEMYFIVKGEMEVLIGEENKRIATLQGGNFFGEIALFMDKPRTATMRAKTFCDLYMLRKSDMELAFEKFPEMGEQIKRKAEEREQENRKKRQ